MLTDLTRLAGNLLTYPRIVLDSSLEGKNYGRMVDGSGEVRVSPTIYSLLLTPAGKITTDFKKVAKSLDVHIVKSKKNHRT